MTVEDRLTSLLERQAAAVAPDADLWERIERDAARPGHRRGRGWVALAAAVVAFTLAVAALAVRGGSERGVPASSPRPGVSVEAECAGPIGGDAGLWRVSLHVAWQTAGRAPSTDGALAIAWEHKATGLFVNQDESHINGRTDSLTFFQYGGWPGNRAAAGWLAAAERRGYGRLPVIDVDRSVPSGENTFVFGSEPAARRPITVAFFDGRGMRAQATTTAVCPVEPPPTTTTLPLPADRACRDGDLEVGLGENGTAGTGRTVQWFVVTNVATVACWLEGYATPTFVDEAGRTVPFEIRHGGSLPGANDPPERVVLQPSGHATFQLEKYRCDTGATASAATMRVVLPGGSRARTVPNGEYAYCGRGDAGSIVAVSPILPPDPSPGPG